VIKGAKTGDLNTAKRWVNCVNDNCATRGSNITPLIYAARACNLELVRVLLKGGAKVEAPAFNNNTALHFAALNGCVDVCRLFLDWGANVDTQRNRKNTPLLEAARVGHLSVVKLLVERGADVSVKNGFGRNASEEARSFGKKDVAEWLDSVVKNCSLKENVSTQKILNIHS
jgi:ankyrin repeat protein